MKKLQLRNIAFTVLSGLVMAMSTSAFAQQTLLLETDQLEFPIVTRQPEDQAVGVGSNVTLTAAAVNADGYQWVRNGVVLDGQTNATLTLENVTVENVGLYTCYAVKGEEAVPTRTADLNVYASFGGGTITVFGTPLLGSGSQGSCPGPFAGYVNYKKTISQGWGWAPSAGTSIHIASDDNRTDTKVEYVGKYGDIGCNQTSVTIDPVYSPKYRFSIYFTNNVPTNAYAITLTGFDQ